MKWLLPAALGAALVAVLLRAPVEVRSLRRDVDALQASLQVLQGDVEELKRGGGKPGAQAEVALDVADAPFIGDKNAKVTVVEFTDYQCGFCARHLSQTVPQIVADYVKTGKVKYVVRDFPLDSIHPAAAKAAEGAHCAGEQGKYWEMHQRLMTKQSALGVKDMPAHARSLNLDVDKFQQCVESGKYAPLVRKGQEEGQKAGVEGTPSFFFAMTPESGSAIRSQKSLRGAYPYPAFKQAIESLLAAQ